MSRFKPGDQVVCIHKGPWEAINKKGIGSGPIFNEECIISKEVVISGFHGYEIVGYEINQFSGAPAAFRSRWFEPLITDSQLEEELKSIEKSKTIELV